MVGKRAKGERGREGEEVVAKPLEDVMSESISVPSGKRRKLSRTPLLLSQTTPATDATSNATCIAVGKLQGTTTDQTEPSRDEDDQRSRQTGLNMQPSNTLSSTDMTSLGRSIPVNQDAENKVDSNPPVLTAQKHLEEYLETEGEGKESEEEGALEFGRKMSLSEMKAQM